MKINFMDYLKRMIIVLILCLSTYSNAISKEIEKNNYIEVPDSVFNSPEMINEYHRNINAYLIKESSAFPYVRMLSLPSFKSEWLITIDEPDEEKATVEYIEVTKPIWMNKNLERLHIIKRNAKIPAKLAKELHDLWKKALQNVRYPRQFSMGLDGIEYYFMTYEKNENSYIGKVWSPSEDTVPGVLSKIGEQLKEFTVSSDEKFLSEIKKLVDEIK